MSTICVTKQFRFEMAHALSGYDGKCSHIHGHSYRLFITIEGTPEADRTHPKYGMVMDFTELKDIVHRLLIDRLDHALLLRYDAPLADALQAAYQKVIKVPYQPTCENMVADFAGILLPALPAHITLHRIRLHETDTSYAEWNAGQS